MLFGVYDVLEPQRSPRTSTDPWNSPLRTDTQSCNLSANKSADWRILLNRNQAPIQHPGEPKVLRLIRQYSPARCSSPLSVLSPPGPTLEVLRSEMDPPSERAGLIFMDRQTEGERSIVLL